MGDSVGNPSVVRSGMVRQGRACCRRVGVHLFSLVSAGHRRERSPICLLGADQGDGAATLTSSAIEALHAGVEWITLDNMSIEEMRYIVVLRGTEGPRLEASGNVTLSTVRSPPGAEVRMNHREAYGASWLGGGAGSPTAGSGARKVRRYADGATPASTARCHRSEVAVANPTSWATRSTGRSLDSSRCRARRSRCEVSQRPGLRPVSSSKRRAKVRVLIAACTALVQRKRQFKPLQCPVAGGPGAGCARRRQSTPASTSGPCPG